MKLTRTQLILILLMVVGLLIRISSLGFQRINWDEEWTIAFANPALTVPQLFVASLTTDCNPPLYYLVAHYSMLLFGETAVAIRLPSVLFGVLLIPCMYLVGREYRDELFGLLMAGFTVIFYNVIFYSKYGRSYSMALVFVTLAFYFFQRTIKGEKRSGILFGVFALLSVWTHLFTVIPLGLMVLYLLWKRLALSGILLLGIGSLPLLNLILVVNSTRISGEGSNTFGSPPLEILIHTPLDLFTYSAVIILPLIVWSVWVHRSELLLRIIAVISLVTWGTMFALSYKTPIIPHYALFLVPMLLLPAVLPFYEAIQERRVQFHHVAILIVIGVMELMQVYWLATMQRGGW